MSGTQQIAEVRAHKDFTLRAQPIDGHLPVSLFVRPYPGIALAFLRDTNSSDKQLE